MTMVTTTRAAKKQYWSRLEKQQLCTCTMLLFVLDSTPEEFPTINCMKWNKSNKFWNSVNSLSRWHFRCCGCGTCLSSLRNSSGKVTCYIATLLWMWQPKSNVLNIMPFLIILSYCFSCKRWKNDALCEIDWKVKREKLHWVFHSKSFN